VSQFGGNAANLGAGNAGTGTPRFVLATDQVALAGLGAGATGSGVPANAIYQGINVGGNQRGQTGVNPTGTVYAAQVDIASVGGSTASYVADISGDADTGAGTSTMVMYGIGFPASGGPVFWPGDATNGGKVQVTQLPNVSIAPAQSLTATSSTAGNFMSALGATASTTDATVECPIVSAATNNATNCKASPGNLYGYEIYNTTTTTYYLRLYNTASAPTCSSATGFVRSIPIPAASAAGQGGGEVLLGAPPPPQPPVDPPAGTAPVEPATLFGTLAPDGDLVRQILAGLVQPLAGGDVAREPTPPGQTPPPAPDPLAGWEAAVNALGDLMSRSIGAANYGTANDDATALAKGREVDLVEAVATGALWVASLIGGVGGSPDGGSGNPEYDAAMLRTAHRCGARLKPCAREQLGLPPETPDEASITYGWSKG
jgi:hypothetical protein